MKIIEHPLYVETLNRIEELERDRIYCGHNLSHLLDVARIMYIRALEEKLDIPRETVYAAALLHDIGRAEEYERGIAHDEAGARLAEVILTDCGYEKAVREQIIEAIGEHRGEAAGELGRLLHWADKVSRICMRCEAADTCKWTVKNEGIEI